MKNILFTGGGSAGHVVPNLALIEELLSAGKVSVSYIGTGGIEKQIVAEWKLPFYQIECPKLIRKGGFQGLKNNLAIPFAFHRAVKQAEEGIRQFQPAVVFSKGGFVALPVLCAAHRLGIPCFTHESDFSPGLANKIGARWCKRVFTSFPETAKKFRRGIYVGAPIKRSVLSASRAESRLRLGIEFNAKVLLIFGGGSGSRDINDAVRKSLKSLTEKYVVLHVCGKGNTVKNTLKNYHQFEFVADMGTLYAACDVVLSRAGAGALFEILALKKPSLLIPLEGQTRGDQLENASYFQRRGLCRILRQNNLPALVTEVENTFLDDGLKARLKEHAFTAGNTQILQALNEELARE